MNDVRFWPLVDMTSFSSKLTQPKSAADLTRNCCGRIWRERKIVGSGLAL
jgi:hypothetical protein